jgi:hypothetical protein
LCRNEQAANHYGHTSVHRVSTIRFTPARRNEKNESLN